MADKTEHKKWATIAASLIAASPDRKSSYDKLVKESIDKMREKMPTADDATLVCFTQSIAFLILSIMNTKVDQLGIVLDSAFDTYSIATATLLGVYEPDEEAVPEGFTVPPVDIPTPTPEAVEPETWGLYL